MKNRILKITITSIVLALAIIFLFSTLNNTSAVEAEPINEIIEEKIEEPVQVLSAPIAIENEEPEVVAVKEEDPLKAAIKSGLAQVKNIYNQALLNITDDNIRYEVASMYPIAARYIAEMEEGDDYEAITKLVVQEFSIAIVNVAGNVIDLSLDSYKALCYRLIDEEIENAYSINNEDKLTDAISSFYNGECQKVASISTVENAKTILEEIKNDINIFSKVINNLNF